MATGVPMIEVREDRVVLVYKQWEEVVQADKILRGVLPLFNRSIARQKTIEDVNVHVWFLDDPLIGDIAQALEESLKRDYVPVVTLQQAKGLLLAAAAQFANVPNDYNWQTMEACRAVITWGSNMGFDIFLIGSEAVKDPNGHLETIVERYDEYIR